MSQSELQRLSADMESDAALRARMEAADPDARAAAARSAGYEIDDSDLEALGDADLDQVSGGGWGFFKKIGAEVKDAGQRAGDRLNAAGDRFGGMVNSIVKK